MAVKNLESYVPKQILALDCGSCLRLPATIPAAAGDIDAGQLMGIRTADKLLLPTRRALITADAANNVKVVTVGAAASKFKVGDTVSWRTLTDATAHDMGAVTAVTATTVTFTNDTGSAITHNQAYLYVADGTEKAVAIMEYAVLNDADVTQGASPYVAGVFTETDLIGFDDVALADLGARRTLGGLVIVPC